MMIERRALAAAPELRGAGSAKMAAGYAALFNSRTQIGDWFSEEIAPGAFTETLKTADVRALIDHNSGRVIGRSTAGTLRLKEDERGLMAEIDLPNTTDGRDLAILMERGDISGMSFGFRVTKETWDETGEMPVRTIQALDLFEVSAVAFPAYEDTEIALRSLEGMRKKTEAEREQREKDRIHKQSGYLIRKAEQENKLRKI